MRTTLLPYAVVALLVPFLLLITIAAPVCGRVQTTARKVEAREEKQVNALPINSKRFALVIGVDRYTDRQISSLEGASNDAKRLAEALIKYAGFPQNQVILCASDQPDERQPTRARILRILSNLRVSVPQDGLLLIFFAGHGMLREGQAYLLPADAEASDDVTLIEDTSINVKSLRERILQTQVKQVILILDACRNNPTGRGVRLGGGALIETYARNFDFNVRNRDVEAFVTLYAASPGQVAYEDKERKQGYFTSALLEGLRGAAADERGEVKLGRLIKYMETAIPLRVSLALGEGYSQKPWAEVGGYKAEELVIAAARPESTEANLTAKDSKPKLYVLAIGINKYSKPEGGLTNLMYAVQDATEFAEEIKKQKGGLYSDVTVKTLTDEKATRKEILGALAWIMRANVGNDVAMIFLAGHGSPDPYNARNTYFLPHDAQVQNMAGTAIPYSDIQKIASLRKGRVVVFIDAVNSGSVAEQLSQGAFDELTRLLDKDGDVVIITSSDSNEIAMEGPRWGGGHGLFTKMLLDILREKPAGGEEVVTVDILFERIRHAVRRDSAFRQNPRLFKSRPDLDFPIVIKR